MPDLLIVEDERDIRNLIVLHLERDGFRCRTAATGVDALREVNASAPDLIVLDLLLPGVDGLEVCRRLRATSSTAALPIIMLTAKADEVDRIVGLEVGADDYIVKPFSPKELVARVRAVLRRVRQPTAGKALAAGGLRLDAERHVVTLSGAPVDLTRKEFDLLQTLMESTGRVLSREQLLQRVWGYTRADEVESRTVDVHVRRLRASARRTRSVAPSWESGRSSASRRCGGVSRGESFGPGSSRSLPRPFSPPRRG